MIVSSIDRVKEERRHVTEKKKCTSHVKVVSMQHLTFPKWPSVTHVQVDTARKPDSVSVLGKDWLSS